MRLELIGDSENLIGLAQQELQRLKHFMSFQNLKQGKNFIQLPTGESILVQSIFGQDFVSINSPTLQVQEESKFDTIPVKETEISKPEPIISVELSYYGLNGKIVQDTLFDKPIIAKYMELSVKEDTYSLINNKKTLRSSIEAVAAFVSYHDNSYRLLYVVEKPTIYNLDVYVHYGISTSLYTYTNEISIISTRYTILPYTPTEYEINGLKEVLISQLNSMHNFSTFI